MIYQDSSTLLAVRGLHATVNGIEILKTDAKEITQGVATR